jgi:hypothetical protein
LHSIENTLFGLSEEFKRKACKACKAEGGGGWWRGKLLGRLSWRQERAGGPRDSEGVLARGREDGGQEIYLIRCLRVVWLVWLLLLAGRPSMQNLLGKKLINLHEKNKSALNG